MMTLFVLLACIQLAFPALYLKRHVPPIPFMSALLLEQEYLKNLKELNN